MNNRSLISLFYFLLISSVTIAQNYRPNSVYINAGSAIFSGQVSVSAEHMIFAINKARTKVKLTAGHYIFNHLDFEDGAKDLKSHFSVSAVQLFSWIEFGLGLGVNTHKFARGIILVPEPDEYYDKLRVGMHPYANIGARHENNGFLIRGGVGYPELLYLGVGVNF